MVVRRIKIRSAAEYGVYVVASQSAAFSLPPKKGAEVGSLSGMKGNVREAVLSYRHPERSRGIFFICHYLFHA